MKRFGRLYERNIDMQDGCSKMSLVAESNEEIERYDDFKKSKPFHKLLKKKSMVPLTKIGQNSHESTPHCALQSLTWKNLVG